MHIAIDHHATFRLPGHAMRLTQLLRLTPDDDDDQTIAAWNIHLGCDTRQRRGRDGFGNRTTMLYVDGPLDALDLSVTGEVLTNPSDGMVHGSVEPLPPALFLRATPLTADDAAIGVFAQDAAASARDVPARLHLLTAALHRQFAVSAAQAPGRTAGVAFGAGQVGAGDLAQILCVAARGLGIPARYVAGFRATGAGAATPHAWAEAHVAGLGWATFDPSAGAPADEGYIRVAVALDALGAAPIAGPGWGDGLRAGPLAEQ